MSELPPKVDENELREKQAEKIVDFLNRIGAYEYVQQLRLEPEKRPSFEEFRDFLIRINGILRDIPIVDRKTDGTTVQLVGFDQALMPKHEDKEKILEESYDALDKINPADDAYLIPAVINAVHLFSDGNGRTSRVVHTLLSAKSKEEFERDLPTSVSLDARFEVQNINPGLISVDVDKVVLMKHGIKYQEGDSFLPIFPEGFALLFATAENVTNIKAKQFMYFCSIDQPYCFVAARDFLEENGLTDKVLLKMPEGVAFSPAKMEKELKDSDWDEIIERYYKLKKEHIEVIINSFIEPHSFKNLDGTMDLKDFFKKEIEFELAKYQD